MNMILKLSAAGAVLVSLSACDMLGLNREKSSSNSTTSAASNASGMNMSGANMADADKNESATGGLTPASAPFTGQVNNEFLVGRWTDNNDCTATIEFRADGRFIAATGEGLWVLDGDQLTMQGQRAITARVQAPDANTITLIHADGTLGRSTRCTP